MYKKIEKTVTLVNTSEGHNKFYTVCIAQREDGKWVVPVSYGPLRGWRKSKVYLPQGVSQYRASKYLDAIVLKKKNERGYRVNHTNIGLAEAVKAGPKKSKMSPPPAKPVERRPAIRATVSLE